MNSALIADGKEISFFNKNAKISFHFLRNGVVDGRLNFNEPGFSSWRGFSGVYTLDEDRIKLAFILEWANPDDLSRSTTTYSGEILRYDLSGTCIILQWLCVLESQVTHLSNAVWDCAVFFDRETPDVGEEMKKVLAHMPADVFQKRVATRDE